MSYPEGEKQPEIEPAFLESKDAFPEPEKKPVQPEDSALVEKEIREARQKLDGSFSEKPPAENGLDMDKKIIKWQEKYTPDYLKGKPGILDRLATGIASLSAEIKGFTIGREDRENIPEKGPFLVICNHGIYGGSNIVIDIFKDYDIHIAAGEKTNWDYRIKNWFMKRLRMISVDESMSNLSGPEKEELLERAPIRSRSGHREIAEREEQGRLPVNLKFLKQSLALLLRGDAVGMFPEGTAILTGEEGELKKGYGGIELLTKQYKKLTGEDLPVLPVAMFSDKKTQVRIGKPLRTSENNTGMSNTDWMMSHIAGLLPEEKRGYYSEMAENEK